ncbi:MAG TPA: pilin [Lysobacter sp.]|nr:pilin [Lysobacter sp.]
MDEEHERGLCGRRQAAAQRHAHPQRSDWPSAQTALACAAPAYAPARLAPIGQRGLLSGWMRVTVGLAVLFLVALGVLAALAIPAYRGYVVRTRIAEALQHTGAVRAAMVEHARRTGVCPRNDEGGFGTPESYAGPRIAALHIGTLENEHCAVAVQLRHVHPHVDGSTLLLEAVFHPRGTFWRCHGGTLPARYLPPDCRSVSTHP